MSIIANNLLQGDEGYNIARSLRFRSSASATLSRTPSVAGNQKTWTYSTWVKRGKLGGTSQQLLTSRYPTASWFVFGFRSDDTIEVAVTAGTSNGSITSAVFRDPSAWYHVVLAFDTTQATASNRVKVYVNNVLQTFASTNYPALNTDYQVNQNISHTIGGYSGELFDGYMTETIMVDGQQLTPSSFGETDAVTGVWKAKKYAGTYGTNGFYLPFSDNSALTSGSNAGLGKDFSGNGNYWTTNNISVTTGTTYDSMKDVPTLTDADTANYCVLNPLRNNGAIANGNLLFYGFSGQANNCNGTFSVKSGKWYFEGTAGYLSVGIINISVGYINSNTGGTNHYLYNSDGTKNIAGSSSAYGASYSTNDIIGIALDCDAGQLTFYKNGVSQGVATTGIGSIDLSPFIGVFQESDMSFNFGQRPWAYTPPTGFKALNTFNLPEPSIKAGNKHFNAITYTGDGTGSKSIIGVGFQPDLVWVKPRSILESHLLNDSVRGVGDGSNARILTSNNTEAENWHSPIYGYLSAFSSDGFATTAGSTSNGRYNGSGVTYAAWNWKANGSAVSNTAGSITSTVSANPTAGFSVVTYTGTGSNATVGHGLGVAPKLIFIKRRDSTSDWSVYYNIDGLGAGVRYLLLNSTAAGTFDTTYWNSTAATSSVFSLGTNGNPNTNTGTYVAYCFSEVAGYSKFGSYTGNGSTDGTFVHLGFRPKFVMMKRTDTGGTDWILWDSARNTYNVVNEYLAANLSDAATTAYTNNLLDFVSNGFKLRHTASGLNASGGTYIYMAFAENPTKYALGR